MAYKCENCTKGILHGHRVSHAKNRTNRVFKPNLQYAKIDLNGRSVRMRLCVKCMRMLKKITTRDLKVKETANVAV